MLRLSLISSSAAEEEDKENGLGCVHCVHIVLG
jgi:hypothetical protein